MKTYIVDFECDGSGIGFYVVVCANNRHAAKRKACKMVKNGATKEIREDLNFISSPVYFNDIYRSGNKWEFPAPPQE